MGFKDFFVEKISDEEEYNYVDDCSFEEYENAELNEVRTDTLIEDIYNQNDLSDKSKSIFKIEDLINSLPKEMVTNTKRNSVLATLEVFGLTVEDVSSDGERRVEMLSSILSKIVNDGNNTILSKETEIENYKKEIERLEKEISDTQTEIKTSEENINSEVKRIDSLICFVNGGEK